MEKKEQLITDIERLLNRYSHSTHIDRSMLAFMDEHTLKDIIGDILTRQEQLCTEDIEWLRQFKKES